MSRYGKTLRMQLAKARIDALEEAAAIARRRFPTGAAFTPLNVHRFTWAGDDATGEAIAAAIESLARETKL